MKSVLFLSLFLAYPDPCSSSALHHGPKKVVQGIWFLPCIGMTFVRCFPRLLATWVGQCARTVKGTWRINTLLVYKLNDHVSGHVSLKNFLLLGSERCSRQLVTNSYHCRKWIPCSRRKPCHNWWMWDTHGYEVRPFFAWNIKADCSKATVKHSRPTTLYGKLEWWTPWWLVSRPHLLVSRMALFRHFLHPFTLHLCFRL